MNFIRAERELIICYNLEDADNNYFTIWTTEKGIFRKICKKIGGEDKLIRCRKTNHTFEFEVPIQFFSKNNFGIKSSKENKSKKKKLKSIGESLVTY